MYEWNRPDRRRLGVEIPTEIHQKIKNLSTTRNCTITKWVLRALVAQIEREEKRNNVKDFHE